MHYKDLSRAFFESMLKTNVLLKSSCHYVLNFLILKAKSDKANKIYNYSRFKIFFYCALVSLRYVKLYLYDMNVYNPRINVNNKNAYTTF